MAEQGRLITFEGGEGAGKTTQIERLAARLGAAGITVELTREPGGTPGAEAIRELLVGGRPERWLPLTELLLVLAARHDHLERRIRPALAAGRWVLCDRYTDSTKVYQGLAGGLDLAQIERLHALALAEPRPDLTILLDVPVEQGLARRRRVGAQNRFDAKSEAFHGQVRQGFLTLAAAEPERIQVIDASGEAAAVEQAVAAAVAGRLDVRLAAAG